MKEIRTCLIGPGVLLLALAAGCAKEADHAASARTPLYYRNPMDPAITSPTPAKDSMGMDYVPVYAGERTPGTVEISPTVVNALGVRTVAVESAPFVQEWRGSGVIGYDEREIRELRVRTDGWVEELAVRSQG